MKRSNSSKCLTVVPLTKAKAAVMLVVQFGVHIWIRETLVSVTVLNPS